MMVELAESAHTAPADPSPGVLFVGWDVGPWKCSGDSQDAIHALRWSGQDLLPIGNPFRGNLLSELKGGITVDSLLAVAGIRERPIDCKVIIGIDAVFGWPKAFVGLVGGTSVQTPSTGKGDRNTKNRYLYRETERFLDGRFDLKSHPPMTAVGDAIGSAATKAQHVIIALRKQHGCYVPPLDPWDSQRAAHAANTLIEVYPGVTRASGAFQSLELPKGSKVSVLSPGDARDAIRCALVCVCYASTVGIIPAHYPTVFLPTDARSEDGCDVTAVHTEGWVFTPKP